MRSLKKNKQPFYCTTCDAEKKAGDHDKLKRQANKSLPFL